MEGFWPFNLTIREGYVGAFWALDENVGTVIWTVVEGATLVESCYWLCG